MTSPDPNETISPQEARTSPRLPRTSGSRVMRALDATAVRVVGAIEETADKRQERKDTINPTVLFVWGIVRKAFLGMPFAGFGFWRLWVESNALDKLLAISARQFAFVDLIRFIPAALMLLIAYGFFAPDHVEAAFRFVGLGGIVDKIIDRLPFLKRKEGQ